MEYNVTVTEKCYADFTVEANSQDEAYEKVQNMYDNAEIYFEESELEHISLDPSESVPSDVRRPTL